jgi:hypothetical protein
MGILKTITLCCIAEYVAAVTENKLSECNQDFILHSLTDPLKGVVPCNGITVSNLDSEAWESLGDTFWSYTFAHDTILKSFLLILSKDAVNTA